MLKYKNGSFHAGGVSFRLPEGACLETEAAASFEYGLTAWLEKHNLWFEIFVDDEDDPRADLETLFTDESSTFVPYSPITEILHNGMRGHEVFYHDSKSDYYECRLIVSEGISVVFYAWCHRDSVKNIKALPEIQEALKNIRIEEKKMEHNQSEFQMNLGQMLRMQRKNAGLSQSETAEKLGISLTSYVYYEMGRVCPNLVTVKKMAEVFGVEPSLFLDPEQFIA